MIQVYKPKPQPSDFIVGLIIGGAFGIVLMAVLTSGVI